MAVIPFAIQLSEAVWDLRGKSGRGCHSSDKDYGRRRFRRGVRVAFPRFRMGINRAEDYCTILGRCPGPGEGGEGDYVSPES